jgi:hypothetical protein
LGVIIGAQAAATWTVCASGCAYTSIEAAIAAPTTLNGDTLEIVAGTYTEPGINVSKSLTLQGESAATTIVQAATTLNTAHDGVFIISCGTTVVLQELTIRHGTNGGLDNYGQLMLANGIVAKNPHGGDWFIYSGPILSRGYNLDSDGSCNLTGPTDRPGVDPLLVPLQNNSGPTFTHALLPGSPAIDAIPWGTNGCGTTLIGDQRWPARPQAAGGRCDTGAYGVEVGGQPLSAWVAGVTPQTVSCQNITTGQQVTLSDHATAWDCETAGLGVTAGDRVSLLVRGPVAKGATDVGGAVTGMTPSSAGCTNQTTGQEVWFQWMVGATAASCAAAGLVVQAGDDLEMGVQGAPG